MLLNKICITIITIITIGLIWLTSQEVLRFHLVPIANTGQHEYSRDELAARMKYHGIDWCFKDDGVWMFKRNGKDYKLF